MGDRLNRTQSLPQAPSSTSPSASVGEGEGEGEENDVADGDEEQEERVMSEIHLGCPPDLSGPYISRFTVFLPHEIETSRCRSVFKDDVISVNEIISLDVDGDLVLPRRIACTDRSTGCYTISIRHNITSTIPSVGLQVWKAELVLSDFVLHKILNSSELLGIIALELGAGTGLVGLLLGRVATTVFLTDRGDEVLDNCLENVYLNSGFLNSQAAVHVRELDWFSDWPRTVEDPPSANRFSWTAEEIEEVQKASLLLAADVIYSDDLTDAFFSILEKLMSTCSKKVLYLALEKRYNFSLNDLNVVANGYLHFRSYFKDDVDIEGLEYESLPCFIGEQIDVSQIPQYIREYDRGDDVEVWKIFYCPPKQNHNSDVTAG